MDNAADNLEGRTLSTGWVVTSKVSRQPGATGGFFSVCYTVTKDREECFLKAFNFVKFFQLANGSGQQRQVVDVISDMVDAYRYERDLSAMCKAKRVSKVSFVRDSGEEVVQGFAISVVPYLIFDVADGGDVRSQLSFAKNLEASWKLRSLHSVAVGLQQLHAIDVSHQDLKPSNVLLFNDESKIGDLGRSTCLSIPSPLRDTAFAGEWSYAPPEILYGVHDPDWRRRSFASDCYLFGSLIVFYFSGLTMTALLRKNLSDDVSWEKHQGAYADVLAYVLDAFARSLDEFADCLDIPHLRKELLALVSTLCHPIPSRRSFAPAGSANLLDMQRLISRLDLLHKTYKYRFGR